MNTSVKPRIITIEGNIGAGKSTLVDLLKTKYADRTDVMFLQEPVDVWSKITQDGKTMLELFYGDQPRYSFAFQVLAYTTRLQMIENAVAEASTTGVRVIVMERSLEADMNIFAKMLYDSGVIEECMYKIYLLMSEIGLEKYKADGVLWVNAGPATCLERIKKRSREGEDGITLGYLETCDAYHREWLENEKENVFLIEDLPDWDEIRMFLF
jgi:deoxyadenosine/deoxycytidine kinase